MSFLQVFTNPQTIGLLPDGWYIGGVKQKSWSSKGNNVVSSYGIYVPEESSPGVPNAVSLSGATDTVSGSSSSVQTNVTAGSGLVLAYASGVVVDLNSTLDFKGGNDYLYGTGNALGVFFDDTGFLATGAAGIINAGSVLMGSGQDQVSGYGNATSVAFGYATLANAAVGVGILNAGALNSGADADTISGTGNATLATAEGCSLVNASVASGVFNVGLIDMGSGNNRLVASATATSTQAQTFSLVNGAVAAGLFNGLGVLQGDSRKSTITSSGSGDKSQEINGTASAVLTGVLFDEAQGDPNAFAGGAIAAGIWNGVGNKIVLANGSAKITGTATAQADYVDTGALLDVTLAAGILNLGEMSTGSANDTITGLATTSVSTLNPSPIDLSAGIANFGVISMGGGNDVLDALTGGFKGNGIANLGSGGDTVKGFGTGYFDGGANIDLLTLNTGSYGISATANKFNAATGLNYFTITSSDLTEMYVTNFERLTTSGGVVGFAGVTGTTVTV